MSYRITPLTPNNALEILSWRYPEPFDFYDPPFVEDTSSFIEQFLRPELHFHGIWDDRDSFVGFCSFGSDGQVLGGDYSQPGIDIGLGMRPELTGEGRGYEFFKSIFNFALNHYEYKLIRLTVADFNHRALYLYQKFGFSLSQQFLEPLNGVRYSVFVLEIAD